MSEPTDRFQIPADVEPEDKIIAGLTARQCAVLAVLGVVLWIIFILTRAFLPLWGFAMLATPLAAFGGLIAFGARDGTSLDRLLLAAVRFARSPRRMVPTDDAQATERIDSPPDWVDADGDLAPPAPLRLPATGIGRDGVINLGPDGAAAIIACSTVNFALSAAAEQQARIAAFARVLHAAITPIQILVRAQSVDLGPLIDAVTDTAPNLPHPALEDAAREHARYLTTLTSRADLLSRQVLLAVRVPHPPGAARTTGTGDTRAVLRHAGQLARALTAAGISARVLTGHEAHTVLAACCDPTAPGHPHAGRPQPSNSPEGTEGGPR